FSIQHNHSSAPDRESESAGTNTSLCNWILDFLTGRPQSVRIGNSISSTTTLNTGTSQGCVLNPLLFTLLTQDCAAMHRSNHIIKFANDTTVVGLISKNDESAYREEVQRLTARCITAWFGNCTVSDRKTLQRIVRTAEKIIGDSLPSITDIYTTRCHLERGCDLSGDNNLEEITQHQSGSVLLPCSCSDLHTKPQKFIWETFRTGPLTEVLNDEHYRGRLQRFNNISPGNLSLLISDLREEDEGVYRCSTKKEYRDFQVYVKGTPPGVLRCGRPLVHGVGLFVWSQWKSSASEGSRMSAASTHERSSRPYPSQSMRYCSRDRTRLESRRARTWLLTGHSSPFRRVRQFEEGHMKGGTYAVRRREPKPIHHWIDLPDDLEQTDKLGTEFVAWQLEAEVTGG
ncbi:hypothetical protein QTP70_003697, partial [Hemibagrus guttatus]